jgi:hypothetical protein
MENILFHETQRFRQPWLWLLLLGGFGVITWGVIQQVILGDPWGDNPAPDGVLIGTWLLHILLIAFIWMIRLEVRISTERIRYRFYPLHGRFREVFWEEVRQAGHRQYRPILEYGGWGIRWGFRGKAFNIAGREGLQLVFIDDSRLLLGTQQPEAIKEAMDYLYHEKVVAPLDE